MKSGRLALVAILPLSLSNIENRSVDLLVSHYGKCRYKALVALSDMCERKWYLARLTNNVDDKVGEQTRGNEKLKQTSAYDPSQERPGFLHQNIVRKSWYIANEYAWHSVRNMSHLQGRTQGAFAPDILAL